MSALSTFDPSKHDSPEVLQIEIWRGEGVRITYNGEVVCQGRSVNDMLKAIGQFVGLRLTVDESPANNAPQA